MHFFIYLIIFKQKFNTVVQNIEIWPNGPSSQFKNKFLFIYTGVILHPHYPWDTMKQLATETFMKRKAITKNANSRNHATMTKDYNSTTLFYLQMENLLEIVNNAFPETLHIHCMKQDQSGKI